MNQYNNDIFFIYLLCDGNSSWTFTFAAGGQSTVLIFEYSTSIVAKKHCFIFKVGQELFIKTVF